MARLRPASALLGPLLAALLAGCAARVAPAPEAPRVHTLEVGNALLWEARPARARAEGGRLYLLGAIHALDAELVLGPRLRAAFDASDELLVELDTLTVDPAYLVDTAAYYGRLPPAQRLDELLDPPTRERLARFLEVHPPPERLIWDVQHTQPWLLWTWVTAALFDEEEIEGEQGVDRFFMASAGEGRPVTPLETVEDQFSAMAGLPLEAQATALAETLASWDGPPEARTLEIRAMIEAWKAGDGEALLALGALDPVFSEPLLHRRNEAMAERLAARLERGGTGFVVVGALHLLGEESLVELLRRRGYRVERLR